MTYFINNTSILIFILLIITLMGCKKRECISYITKERITTSIDTIIDPSFKLSALQQEKIVLLKYLDKIPRNIIELFYPYDFSFFEEDLYNANLFRHEIINAETKKSSYTVYNNRSTDSISQYYFNKSGLLSKVINVNNKNNYKQFYYTNGRLTKIIHSMYNNGFMIQTGNDIQIYKGKVSKNTLRFFYDNQGRLTRMDYGNTYPNYQKLQYYSDRTKVNKKYIKITTYDESFLGFNYPQRDILICFNKDELDFIFTSYGVYIKFYDFENYFIRISSYRNYNKKDSIYYEKKYSLVELDYNNHNIKSITCINLQNEWKKEFIFQYFYQGFDNVVGYNILYKYYFTPYRKKFKKVRRTETGYYKVFVLDY